MVKLRNIINENGKPLYAVVAYDWYKKYGYNAFVESQAITSNMEEASTIRMKMELVDGIRYIIIEINGSKKNVSIN